MARLARIVVPNGPHHVIQRGVRSMAIFSNDQDRHAYLQLLATFAQQQAVQVWAWCLMPNHVHFVLVPSAPEALARAVGETHRRYTRLVNFRAGVRGHLFQERFHSFPIQQDRHLLTVVRYIERNPVRAQLARQAEEYRWSSARHHALGVPDALMTHSPIREMAPDWRAFVRNEDDELEPLRRHVRTGRPWGTTEWITSLEQRLGRPLHPRTGGWPKGRRRTG